MATMRGLGAKSWRRGIALYFCDEKHRMVTSDQIDEIIRILAKECRPDRIILFGSYAHGTAHFGVHARRNGGLEKQSLLACSRNRQHWQSRL
jgi:hypothetical protein